MRQHSLLLCTTLALLVFAACWHPTASFDTGHHWDITRTALTSFGFEEKTIQIMQVLNWMVDYYSITVKKISDFQLLHCDTLRNTNESVCYWNRLSHTMRTSVTQASKDKDVFVLLNLLGFSLHAVQDFYSHSSWVETHSRNGSCNCYRSDTYFQYAAGGDFSKLPHVFSDACEMCKRIESRIDPSMVPHGNYCDGINKDSIVRPNHEEAFVFAFIASIEWINSTKGWVDAVDSSLWSEMASYKGVKYMSDWTSAFKLSLWALTGPDNDGHWKGSGSGSALRGLVRFLYWSIKPDSSLISKIKKDKVFQQLTNPSPYSSCADLPPANASIITPVTEEWKSSWRAVIVRTTEIFKTAELDLADLVRNNFTNVPKTSYALYAVVGIDGQEFVEPTQKSILHPYWTSIKMVDLSKLDKDDPVVNITYQLWQENSWKDNTPEDINSFVNNSHYITLKYHVNSEVVEGDVSGLFNTPNNTIRGIGSMSFVRFFITTASLTGCGNSIYYGNISANWPGNWPSQCTLTAPARYGLPDICTPKGIRYAKAQFRNAILALSLPLGFLILSCLIGSILCLMSRRRHKRRKANIRNNVVIPSFDDANVPLLANDDI